MVNFTREPIIESIITPKEGCKLVVRNSKGVAQEEYFVDALEMVSFGTALFYRSNEKPKAFLLPVSDYEVLEVRDARLVLKTGSSLPRLNKNERNISKNDSSDESSLPGNIVEVRQDKKRRRSRRKKDKDEAKGDDKSSENTDKTPSNKKKSGEDSKSKSRQEAKQENKQDAKQESKGDDKELKKMLVPPPILISDTISRYKDIDEANGQIVSDEVTMSINDGDNESTKPLEKQELNSVKVEDQVPAFEDETASSHSAAPTEPS